LFSEIFNGSYGKGKFADRKIVGSVKSHFGVHIVVQALDDGYHGNDGENTDNDSQQSEECPELARPERTHGHSHGFTQMHSSDSFIHLDSLYMIRKTEGIGFFLKAQFITGETMLLLRRMRLTVLE